MTMGDNSKAQLQMDCANITLADMVRFFDENEIWREISGYPGYQISSWGRVRGKRVEILSHGKTFGYHTVSLSDGTKCITERVSRLVAEAFLGVPPFAAAQAAHNDGDKDNNRVSNIRWATAQDNQDDVDRHGHRPRGEEVCGARLKDKDIPHIRRRILSGERYPRIAADFNVSISTISLIKRGRIWRHV